MKKADSFSIDIVLRHPSYSPGRISDDLSVVPQAFRAAGGKHEGATARSTFFSARLEKGEASSEYDGALTRVATFIEKHATFWSNFIAGHGEIELVLNLTVLEGAGPGDLCLSLRLAPRFLAELSNHGFAVRFQGWRALSKPGRSLFRHNVDPSKAGKPQSRQKRPKAPAGGSR